MRTEGSMLVHNCHHACFGPFTCSEEEPLGSPDSYLDRQTPSHYSISSDDDCELPSVSTSIGGHQNPAADSITTGACDDTEEAIIAQVLAESLQEKVPERFVYVCNCCMCTH